MDFMKVIKSLEQLLYELMVWLVFYPLTLWRSVAHPLKLMDYADDEIDDPDDDRYSDTLSPPIFLAITLALVHLFEIAQSLNVVEDGLLADHRNLVAFRLVAFALFPLMMSLRLLQARHVPLDRKTLRPPFYAQCFIAAPFALGIDLGALLMTYGHSLAGIVVLVLVALWYLVIQAMWFQRMLGVPVLRAVLHALLAWVMAWAIAIVLGATINQL